MSRREQRESCETKCAELKTKARAFVELTSHIENSVEEGIYYFRFAELLQLYEHRLQQLGLTIEVNKPRFKEQVLKYFPEAQAQSEGKNVVLVFPQGMQRLIKDALKKDYEGDASILVKAAKICREDIFETEKFRFDGTFPPSCQENSVPTTLKMLVSMMVNGTGLTQQDPSDSQQCLTICQTILFNSKKKASSSTKTRHSAEAEPLLPVYLGMKVHTQTRSRKLVKLLHNLGLSASYNRIVQIESQLASAVCQRSIVEGVVCPSQMRRGLFTVGALDNIDHNPSSTTAQGSFHGTGISLFQSPSSSNMGHCRDKLSLPSEDTRHHLPDRYTTVPAVALDMSKVEVPDPANPTVRIAGDLVTAMKQEHSWLASAIPHLKKEELENGDVLAWAAYHAEGTSSSSCLNDVQPAITQLLPFFYEKAATVAMVKHGMSLVQQTTDFLNTGQVPVLAMDATLFAIAKHIQWRWPETHGEAKFVIMFGGLHIEMAMWKTYGDFMQQSGWIAAIIQAGVASSGSANAVIGCSHLTRTRHVHQVSALALARLQNDAFQASHREQSDEERESWRQEMIKKKKKKKKKPNVSFLGHHTSAGATWSDLCSSPQSEGFHFVC